MVIKVTEETFENEVLKSELPVLVDCYADWCGPCKMMAPVLEKMAEKFEGRLKVCKMWMMIPRSRCSITSCRSRTSFSLRTARALRISSAE